MIISMAVATIGFSYAQQDQNMQQQQQEMTTIDREDLPNEVQTTLQTEEFREWEIEQAYEIEEGVGDYAVRVKRGEETKILHFSEDGKLVRQEDVEGGMKPGNK